MKIKETKDAPISTEKSVFDETHDIIANDIVVEENVVEEKEELLPMSLVRKLLLEVEERLTKKFNTANKKAASQEYLDEEESYVRDLEEDWLDTPVVFFAFSFNFAIHGDKKRGVETAPPHGAIKFKPLIRTKKKGLKGIQVVSVSSVKINSKVEAEYVRSHSQFGIAFYENMESALNVDSTWAQKMVEAQQSISRLSDMQIIARAKQEGVSISQSPEGMRRQLVELVAKRSIKREDELLYGAMRKSNLTKEGRTLIETK